MMLSINLCSCLNIIIFGDKCLSFSALKTHLETEMDGEEFWTQIKIV